MPFLEETGEDQRGQDSEKERSINLFDRSTRLICLSTLENRNSDPPTSDPAVLMLPARKSPKKAKSRKERAAEAVKRFLSSALMSMLPNIFPTSGDVHTHDPWQQESSIYFKGPI